ncbi:MAG: hypothetical protein JWN79_1688 [Gemmatimonadetes bacterium]|nr:hypothetical protein [Gemmatimonadota bacterium]
MTGEGAGARRVVTWGLVVVTLVVAVGAGALVLRRASGAIGGFGRSAAPVITQQVVVEQLREVAKLVATEMTLRDVVIYEQRHLLSTKRVLLVVTGRVGAGIDLQAGAADVRIDSAARHIVIALRPAQILSVEVLNVTTYDERAGLLNPFTPEDRDLIQRRIRSQLEEAARQSGILRHADESAAKVLTNLLSRDGYTVEIERPLVIQKPVG